MKYKRNRPYRLLSYKPIEEADNLIIIGLFDVSGKRKLNLSFLSVMYQYVPANLRFSGHELVKPALRRNAFQCYDTKIWFISNISKCGILAVCI